jgi:succinoglycan biosynthesis transport protein ExoP
MVGVPRHETPVVGQRDRSLLRTQARWILTVTLLAVVSALVLAWALHDPAYRSQVQVLVNPTSSPSGAPVPTNMDTERQVVLSTAVASVAAQTTGTSAGELQRGLSATVPAGTTLLVLEYQDSTAAGARRNAQAIADAYTVYRAGQAAVLSPATTPRSATPSYLVNAVAGLALGLLVGIGSAVLRDRRDDRLRGPADFSEQTGLPVLVTVPARHGEDDLAVLDDPWSPDAEAYRQLQVKIRRTARCRQGSTAITLVTGTADAEGAARVAANTAAALAVSGFRVLLVEGDLRSAGSGEFSDGPHDLGLGEVLAGHVPLLEAVSVGRTDRLMLLRAGTSGSVSPGELFNATTMDRLLRQVPADVDHVVLHAPSVLLATETLIMAERADRVVLVESVGSTRRRDLRTGVGELRAVDAALLGGVLEVPPLRSRTPGPTSRPTTTDVSAPDSDEVATHRADGRLDAAPPGAERPGAERPGAERPGAERPDAGVATAPDE